MAHTKGSKTARWSESHQNASKFGSGSATRPREGGVATNRGSACRGEYVPGPCTHRPSHHGSRQYPKSTRPTPFWGGVGRRQGLRLGGSRNKVAVPEGAAGSPPF